MHFHLIRIIKFGIISLIALVCFHFINRHIHQSKSEFVLSEISLSRSGFVLPEIPSSKSSKLPSVAQFEQLSYTLEPYTTRLPHFSDDESRDWFFKSTYYQMYSKQCPNSSCEKNGFLFDNLKEHRQVHLALVQNGLYLNDDCGYNYGDEAIRRTFKSSSETSVIYDRAIIYTVPDGWSFQHFLDGIGPKLSHSRTYLDKYPDAKVVIVKGPRLDQSVKDIWALLGVKESHRLIHYRSDMKLGARLLINPCRTPGTHPDLWHNARRIYWSLTNLSQSDSTLTRNKLIYMQRTRANSKNSGRFILNDEPLVEIIRQYANKSSLDLVLYDHSKQVDNIQKQIQLFYQARVIIGVHGGAQSNMNFAQPGTTIIEIMPYHSDQSTVPVVCRLSHPGDLRPCVGYIYYVQSQLLNHSYWILPTVANSEKNLHVDLTRVKRLFDSLT